MGLLQWLFGITVIIDHPFFWDMRFVGSKDPSIAILNAAAILSPSIKN
jgi:hypothetical protein